MQQFLIVRSDDLIHIGVQCSDFRLEYSELDERVPLLVATSDLARITLTFPPQVIGEEVYVSEDSLSPLGIVGRRRSGASRVQFAVPAGTTMELNAEGVLRAIMSSGVSIIQGNDPPTATAIEIPWGLIFSMVPISRNGKVVPNHEVTPVTSDSGIIGLWYTKLREINSNTEDAGIALLPISNRAYDIINFSTNEVLGPPLVSIYREKICQNSNPNDPLSLPKVKRLELSSFGGTFSVTAKWSNFAWDHDVVLGRDKRVRVMVAGVLFPFGHKAYAEVITERQLIKGNAVLANTQIRLVVTEPVINISGDNQLTREFPFEKVEILVHKFDIDQPPLGKSIFIPKVNQNPLRFPIRCTGTNGDVYFEVPLVFAHEQSSHDFSELSNHWKEHKNIKLPGVPINMVKDVSRNSEVHDVFIDGVKDNNRSSEVHDVFEVHELCITSILHEGRLYPKMEQFTAELPALRELQDKPSMLIPLKYTQEYKDFGLNTNIALEPVGQLEINFTERPDRSGGLMAPMFMVGKISRTHGPIPMPNMDVSDIFKDAKLLGLPLASIIGVYDQPPKIVPIPGNPPGAKMEWRDLKLRDYGPFRSNNSTATLIVERSPSKSEMWCEVKSFAFVLPLDLVKLKFGSLAFIQKLGFAPVVEISGLEVEFQGALKLLDELLNKLKPLLGGNKPEIHATSAGISAKYRLAIPDVPAGAFLMRNVSVQCGVEIPFSSNPVTLSLGFGRRDNPFNLSVLMFGGGGYIDVQFGQEGITRLEALLEFGGMVEVNFLIARAEVHALGGVRFITSAGPFDVDAFIRIGGSVEVLGLVSVSVELVVKLNYKSPDKLTGRATLVIEVDLPLFSESVTIDSGEWELIGGNSVGYSVPLNQEDTDSLLIGLQEYYEAFA